MFVSFETIACLQRSVVFFEAHLSVLSTLAFVSMRIEIFALIQYLVNELFQTKFFSTCGTDISIKIWPEFNWNWFYVYLSFSPLKADLLVCFTEGILCFSWGIPFLALDERISDIKRESFLVGELLGVRTC